VKQIAAVHTQLMSHSCVWMGWNDLLHFGAIQVLVLLALLVLYWYKRTNTDMSHSCVWTSCTSAPFRYSLYLLYWYKRTNTGTKAPTLTLRRAVSAL
jgi:hypothetical protein